MYNRLVRFLERSFVYNGVLRAFVESTLIFLISSITNLSKFETKSMSDKVNILLSVSSLLIILAIPLLSIYLRYKRPNAI